MSIFVVTLVMIFSMNVFAAEGYIADMEWGQESAYDFQTASYYPVYRDNFECTYTFPYTKWGKTIELRIPVKFEIRYSYSEGNWYDVYYSNITIYEEDVTVDGEAVLVQDIEYISNSSGSHRWIKIAEEQLVHIYIRCSEWGVEYGAELQD